MRRATGDDEVLAQQDLLSPDDVDMVALVPCEKAVVLGIERSNDVPAVEQVRRLLEVLREDQLAPNPI